MSIDAQVAQDLTDLLKVVVSAGVVYVAKYVKAHYRSQAANNAIDGLGQIANATVADFNQQVVSDAKAQGVFTPELAQSVKQDAIVAVKAQGKPLLKLVSRSVDSVDALISSLIEKAVVANKA